MMVALRFSSARTLTIVALFHLIGSAMSSILDCASVNAISCFKDTKIRKHYDGIDHYLKDFVPTEDPKTIMSIFEAWIKRESVKKLNPQDALRLKALVQLHNLVLTDGPGRCTSSTSRILADNDQALRGVLSKLEIGQTPRRPIERLVNHYAKEFIAQCDYEKMLHDLDADSLKYVKNIVGEYVGSRAKDDLLFPVYQIMDPSKFVNQQPAAAKSFAKSMKGIRPQRDAALIYRLLTLASYGNFDPMSMYLKKVRRDSDGQLGVDNQKVFKLYRKYIGKPCEKFVERVESSFGSNWALGQSFKLHKKQGTESELYKNRAYYYGCKIILSNEEILVEGLRIIVAES